ncbi:hypothetical protein NliqN6_0166 [Naganishia liquefaciens]|uniref:Ubiquitin-like protease family profile domain-containing protein n=1 Tax=Naganishia liquefaciens TaxID=104408 RepID=A0A8H3TP53_9TREE|nr:hypothetical protein NliqN6_0166 [Naganishia liquefaciens]
MSQASHNAGQSSPSGERRQSHRSPDATALPAAVSSITSAPPSDLSLALPPNDDDPFRRWPLQGQAQVELTVRQAKCLAPGQCSNADVIAFILHYWHDRMPLRASIPASTIAQEDVLVLDTYFFDRIRHVTARVFAAEGPDVYQRVERSLGGRDPFAYKMVILPVHWDDCHWFLAVVLNPDKILDVIGNATGPAPQVSRPRRQTTNDRRHPVIVTLDSGSGERDRRDVGTYVNRWLYSRALEVLEAHATTWPPHTHFPALYSSVQSPLQPNMFDCGIFLLHFAHIFMFEYDRVEGQIFASATPKMPVEQIANLWRAGQIGSLRERIRNTLLSLPAPSSPQVPSPGGSRPVGGPSPSLDPLPGRSQSAFPPSPSQALADMDAPGSSHDAMDVDEGEIWLAQPLDDSDGMDIDAPGFDIFAPDAGSPMGFRQALPVRRLSDEGVPSAPVQSGPRLVDVALSPALQERQNGHCSLSRYRRCDPCAQCSTFPPFRKVSRDGHDSESGSDAKSEKAASEPDIDLCRFHRWRMLRYGIAFFIFTSLTDYFRQPRSQYAPTERRCLV